MLVCVYVIMCRDAFCRVKVVYFDKPRKYGGELGIGSPNPLSNRKIEGSRKIEVV